MKKNTIHTALNLIGENLVDSAANGLGETSITAQCALHSVQSFRASDLSELGNTGKRP